MFGLEIGVDDYVVKLFLFCEVCVRVCTLLCWVKKFLMLFSVICIGYFELNEFAVQISWFDMLLVLIWYEFLLLKTLFKLLGCVWFC